MAFLTDIGISQVLCDYQAACTLDEDGDQRGALPWHNLHLYRSDRTIGAPFSDAQLERPQP